MHSLKEHRRLGLALVVCGAIVLLWWGASVAASRPLGMLDFRALYYATSGLMHHADPYNQASLHAYYAHSGGIRADDPAWLIYTLTLINYLPPTFPLVAPFALFSWQAASQIWLALTAAGFLAGALIVWLQLRTRMPIVGGVLLAFMLANSIIILGGGNAAGLVIGLCAFAVWSLVEQRLTFVAVPCLAVALALKPHDAGFLWLYFLLAGGLPRKRAVQSLALVAVLAFFSVLWIQRVSPNWLSELRSVMQTYDAPGGANYPGFHSAAGSAFRSYTLPTSPGMTSDLRTIVAAFRDDPRFFTPVTLLICAPLFVLWLWATLRLQPTRRNALLAIAAVAPLSLLPVYHRTTDAKLLLLVLPACAMLWSERDRLRWPALLLTSAAVFLTGDIPLTLIGMSIGPVDWAHTSVGHRILLAAITRPVPLILLLLGGFYLYVYARSIHSQQIEMAAPRL